MGTKSTPPNKDEADGKRADGFDRLLDVAFFLWRHRAVILGLLAFWAIVIWAGLERDSLPWQVLRKILGLP